MTYDCHLEGLHDGNNHVTAVWNKIRVLGPKDAFGWKEETQPQISSNRQ